MNDNNSPAETARQNDNGNNPENRPGPAADTSESKAETTTNTAADSNNESHSGNTSKPGERPDRLDPTRYGDWEKNGRCIDF